MLRHHQHAVDPDLEVTHRRIRRPLRVQHEVVPVPALQRHEVGPLAAGAGGLVHQAEPEVAVVGADVEGRRARLDAAVGVVVPLDQRPRGRARVRIGELVPLGVAAHPVGGPHRLPPVPALVAFVLPERGRAGHQAAAVGVVAVDVAELHLEARGVPALHRRARHRLDLLRTDRLPVAPLILAGAAVARERACAGLEIARPDQVRLLRCCCESRRDEGRQHQMCLQAEPPWLLACTPTWPCLLAQRRGKAVSSLAGVRQRAQIRALVGPAAPLGARQGTAARTPRKPLLAVFRGDLSGARRSSGCGQASAYVAGLRVAIFVLSGRGRCRRSRCRT